MSQDKKPEEKPKSKAEELLAKEELVSFSLHF